VGASNSTHFFGTYGPVEEPSTASIADITPNLFDHRERPTCLVDVRSRYEA
jgi:hypothetical protein